MAIIEANAELMDAENKSPDSKKDAPRRSMERLVRRFGAVWVASQDGMAAIGATRKDALAGLADCIKCKTSLHSVHPTMSPSATTITTKDHEKRYDINEGIQRRPREI